MLVSVKKVNRGRGSREAGRLPLLRWFGGALGGVAHELLSGEAR